MHKQRGYRRISALIATSVLAGAISSNLYADSNLYRYRNAEGVLVVDYSLPPEYSNGGYEILNHNGRLLEAVEPQAEMVEDTISPSAQAEREREDSYILRSYSSVGEVQKAGARKLAGIKREIDILKASIADALQRREQEQQKAANYLRSGRKVPDATTGVIQEIDLKLEQTRTLLEKREAEYQVTEKRYAWYGRRLSELNSASAKTPETASDTDLTSPSLVSE